MNNYTAIGRMTDDAQVVELQRKGSDETIVVCNFTLAIPRIGSDDADFIRCKAFGQTAEFLEDNLGKGSRIGITGRLQTGKYEKDGVTHWTTDVIVERVDFADGKKPEDDKPARKAQANQAKPSNRSDRRR